MLPDISLADLRHVLSYAYTGSLALPRPALPSFLRTAALLRLAGVSLATEDSQEDADTAVPQDLSMKPPPEKKVKVEPWDAPSPAHDSKPETFLRKTLLTFPAPGAAAPLVTPRPGTVTRILASSKMLKQIKERSKDNK